MVVFSEIGNRFDEVKNKLIKLNSESLFERFFLYIILCLNMMFIPIYGFIFINSLGGWNLIFNENNGGYLVAALLLVIPYIAGLARMFFRVLSNPSRFFSSPRIEDLRFILKLNTNNPEKLYTNCIYNVVGASISAVLITVTTLPLVSESYAVLIIFVCILFIWISLLQWFITIIYVMKYAMFDPINDIKYEFGMFDSQGRLKKL